MYIKATVHTWVKREYTKSSVLEAKDMDEMCQKNKRDIGISEESGKVEEEGKNDDVCPANPVHNLLSAIEEWNANNAANCQGHSFEG
jgi:hypothetical protein